MCEKSSIRIVRYRKGGERILVDDRRNRFKKKRKTAAPGWLSCFTHRCAVGAGTCICSESDGALYIADFGLLTGGSAVPGTGVIWRITRET